MESKKSKSARKIQHVIIVPTDFSEVCDNAINHTLQIAKHIKYTVMLLHVINKDTLSYMEKNHIEISSLEEKLKKQAELFHEKSGVHIDYMVKQGKLIKQIKQAVKECGASMLVLGTHGKIGFQSITGSYALKLITKINVPTIVVQQKALIKPYKHIVFPVTIGANDRQKVNWAIYISKIFNSTIHIFPKREESKHQKIKIMSVVKQIKNIFDKHNVKYCDKVSEKGAGNFAKQVIDYAMDNDTDLIMTMVSSESIVPFFDSQDEQIIFNTSQIPVICINPVNVKKQSWH